MHTSDRHSFSGRIGYVLAAAGSAVGLGNIWRFPYLAARYGGGAFLLTYIVLAATFGYTMMISETALGRMTRRSPVGAFSRFSSSPAAKAGGWLNAVIPMLILPYYSVIGGWVCRYLFQYLTMHSAALAQDGNFEAFISDPALVVFWFVFFAACTFAVVFAGVEHGIEKTSTLMMPVLVLLSIVVSIYSVTRPGAIAGVHYLLIPDFAHFSLMTVVAALGQMFYSLSIAMGILITFGSYMKSDVDIEKSTAQVEIFDTAVAILAGLMVIPAVFAFSGGTPEALGKGPALMFVTLPKVFASMSGGAFFGLLFFVLVFFAALTSAVSLAESAVSTIEDELGWGRKSACALSVALTVGLGLLSSLGFNVLSGVTPLRMDILSFFDFLTNSVMMPLAAAAICLLVLRCVGIEAVEKEVCSCSAFRRKRLYRVMVRYFALALLAVIFVSSMLDAFGIIHI